MAVYDAPFTDRTYYCQINCSVSVFHCESNRSYSYLLFLYFIRYTMLESTCTFLHLFINKIEKVETKKMLQNVQNLFNCGFLFVYKNLNRNLNNYYIVDIYRVVDVKYYKSITIKIFFDKCVSLCFFWLTSRTYSKAIIVFCSSHLQRKKT